MFEKEIKFISDFCLNKVKYLGASFTYEKIAATDLHPAILRYISAELDYMIFADRKRIISQSYFDYSGKEISQHFRSIADEIKRSKKISFEDIKKLIIQAVSFNANFVVRPKWSLSKLVYHNQTSISISELEIMLSYIYYYDYIKNVLEAYLSKRNLVELSQTEFDLIFNKIDRELFKDNAEKLIENALTCIGDFFNIGGVDKRRIAPLAVEILLKEKNLTEYLMKLRRAIPEDQKNLFYIEDIKRVLYSATPVKPESLATAEEEAIEKDEDEELLNAAINEIVSSDEPESDSASEVQTDEVDETPLGVQADKHAEEIEKAEMSYILSAEEEDKLLAMYEEDLKETEEDLIQKTEDAYENGEQPEFLEGRLQSQETQNVDEFEEEEIEDKTDRFSEKEIVDEMMQDYFGDEPQTESSSGIQDETVEETPAAEIKDDFIEKEEEKLETLEDELMDVFNEIDRLEKSLDIKQPEPFKENISAEEPVSSEMTTSLEENKTDEEDHLDKDLETFTKIAFEEDNILEQPEIKDQVNDEVFNKTEIRDEIEDQFEEEQEEPAREVESEYEAPKSEKFKNVNEREVEEIVKPVVVRKKDLFTYLKKKEIKKIIANIFGGDEEDFINTAERIMQCPSYKGSSEILKAVFTSYKISPFSKEAVNFTNAVSNYFRQA